MSVKTGRLGWVGIALEATPGVPVSPTDYLPFVESSLQDHVDVIADTAARGIRDSQGENTNYGKTWGEGSLKINLDPTVAPYLLGLAMGTIGAATSQGGGVYTHAFTRSNSNTPKTATITVDRATDRRYFPYCIVNTAQLSFSDGVAELNTTILGQQSIASVSGSISTVSGSIFTFRHAAVQVGANITAAASAANYKLRSFDLTINNNAEAQFVAGSVSPDSLIVKDFMVSGSFRLAFENTAQRDAFLATTKQSMIVTFTGNGIGGGLSEYIKIKIYKMHFQDYKINTPPSDIITEEINFLAEYDTTNSNTMTIDVQNRTNTY